MVQPAQRILVIGGGISGLSAAWFMQQQGHDVHVLEASEVAGGNLRTLREDGYLVEAGPNSTLDSSLGLGQLIEGLGLQSERVTPSALARRRFVVRDGQLQALPGSPVAFLSTSLFSLPAKLRLCAEPFIGRATTEESIASFVRRRLGREFLDYAINPFVSGVYAGDPERLSVQAATAKVYALEARHGSLIKGGIALMKARKSRQLETGPSGTMVSFRHGMQQLPEALAAALGNRLHCGVQVDLLRRDEQGWQVSAGERHWQAQQVILATPAPVSARLLATLAPAASEALAQMVYPQVVSVSMGFAASQIAHPLDGFGMLMPRCEGIDTLGTLFPSSLFEQRAPAGKVLLTSFIGGRLNPVVAQRRDDEIAAQVLADIRPLLGISGEAEKCWVTRWPAAIPQYELGHLQRLQQIDTALAALPGLHCRSNWRDGIAVADCIEQARLLAGRIG